MQTISIAPLDKNHVDFLQRLRKVSPKEFEREFVDALRVVEGDLNNMRQGLKGIEMLAQSHRLGRDQVVTLFGELQNPPNRFELRYTFVKGLKKVAKARRGAGELTKADYDQLLARLENVRSLFKVVEDEEVRLEACLVGTRR